MVLSKFTCFEDALGDGRNDELDRSTNLVEAGGSTLVRMQAETPLHRVVALLPCQAFGLPSSRLPSSFSPASNSGCQKLILNGENHSSQDSTRGYHPLELDRSLPVSPGVDSI
jgi:hypothetical protein